MPPCALVFPSSPGCPGITWRGWRWTWSPVWQWVWPRFLRRWPTRRWLVYLCRCEHSHSLTDTAWGRFSWHIYTVFFLFFFQYGLYSAFMGCFVYCIFGTSKDITLGPTAIMSLLCSAYVDGDPVFAVVLTLLCGVIQTGMALLRLGKMENGVNVNI